MKKIITLLSAALIMTSCSNSNETEATTEIPFADTQYIDAYYTIRKVKIENHTYIMLTGANRAGLAHDPECPYCKEQHKLETTDF